MSELELFKRAVLIKNLETKANRVLDHLYEIAKALGVDTDGVTDTVKLAGECAEAARKSRENKYGHDTLAQPNADHYEFTGETIEHAKETLYRIRSKIARPHHRVKAGDTGGWISPDAGLGRDAWIADNAKVHHHAWVNEKAWVGDHGIICSGAVVHGEARICGSTTVLSGAKICGTTILDGYVIVTGKPHLAGDLRISGRAIVEEATWPRN